MHITIWEFLALTWEWLVSEYEVGDLDNTVQRMRNIINLTQQKAEQWWSWAKRLAIWGTIISFVIFLSGVIIGGFTHLGWTNSVAGLLIAPMLFILLAWWTPLAAIMAVIYEIAHGRIKCAIDVAIAQAKWWLGIVCGILLWQVLVSLAFTFVPYWNAPSRIPILMLLALATALIGIRWNNVTWYRSVIKFLVIGVFITQILVCFLPATATALHSKVGKVDESIADIIKNGFSNEHQAAAKTTTVATRSVSGRIFSFPVPAKGVYTIDGIEIKRGQEFTFLTYDAPIEFRVRNEDGDCWERVDNNLPWRARINGRLEIKAGNIPANVTLNIKS